MAYQHCHDSTQSSLNAEVYPNCRRRRVADAGRRAVGVGVCVTGAAAADGVDGVDGAGGGAGFVDVGDVDDDDDDVENWLNCVLGADDDRNLTAAVGACGVDGAQLEVSAPLLDDAPNYVHDDEPHVVLPVLSTDCGGGAAAAAAEGEHVAAGDIATANWPLLTRLTTTTFRAAL